MVSGLQAAGVAATAKHFPGHGDTSSDSHYGSPRLDHDINRLRQVELLPFAAAVEAGVRLVMSAHISLPALNDGMDLPATLSPNILRGLLRKEMGFEGVTVSDAMDMGAIQQGDNLVIDAIAAAKAGVDLLLLNFEPAIQTRLSAALLQAARRGLLSAEDVLQSGQRILSLKGWLGQQIQPELSVVGCPEHRALADEIAARALTLVQDREKLLPLRLLPEDRLAVIVPEPQDLTPADTSSTVHPSLAQAIQSYHPHLDEFVIPLNPSEADIAGLRAQAGNYKLIIFASFNATQFPAQAQLANVLLETGRPLIAAALRLPYDLQAYPAVGTYLCTYSILPPAMQALAAGLWGKIPIPGRLPVSLPVL
jgi:beta-N-acetylhexosaminidase